MSKLLIECHCHSPEHNAILELDQEYELVYLDVLLITLPWYKRLWVGIKYIFGHRSKYGYYDNIVLDKVMCQKIVSFLNKVGEKDK